MLQAVKVESVETEMGLQGLIHLYPGYTTGRQHTAYCKAPQLDIALYTQEKLYRHNLNLTWHVHACTRMC